MKQGSTLFLRIALVLIGMVALVFCIFALGSLINPELASDVGEYRLVILGMALSAIPFFVAVFQSSDLLNYIDEGKAFSQLSVKALVRIKRCAIIISAWYALGLPFIFQVAEKDDAPGVVLLGIVVIFASLVIAVFAALLQRLVQAALQIKSENDLTV